MPTHSRSAYIQTQTHAPNQLTTQPIINLHNTIPHPPLILYICSLTTQNRYLNRWRSFYVMDRFPEGNSPGGSKGSSRSSITKSLLYKYEDPPRLSDHYNPTGGVQGQLGLNNPCSRRDSGSSTGSDPSW